MTNEAKIKAMAELDGYTFGGENKHDWFVHKNRPTRYTLKQLPNYLHDLNATHRVLCGLAGEKRDLFSEQLKIIVDADWTILSDRDIFNIASATAEQLTDAILKATGRWE